MRRLPRGSHLKCFTTFVTYTSSRAIEAAASARSSRRPAGPTNGWPARSSSWPGCSPISITRARGLPSPNTVCVPRLYRSQPRQPAAAARSAGSIFRAGRKSAADPVVCRRLAMRPAVAWLGPLRSRTQRPSIGRAGDALRLAEQGPGGANDGGGVDAVVPVEGGSRPGLAEGVDAERELGDTEGAAQEGEGVGMTIEDGDERNVLFVRGDEPLQIGPRLAQTSVEPIGAGDDEYAGKGAALGQLLGGRQADARRRRHHDEAAAGVERVIEGVEPARDERIVERADRKQRLTRHLRRQPQRGQEQEEVVLGDAQLDVLPARSFAPLERLRHVGERIDPRVGVVDAPA